MQVLDLPEMPDVARHQAVAVMQAESGDQRVGSADPDSALVKLGADLARPQCRRQREGEGS